MASSDLVDIPSLLNAWCLARGRQWSLMLRRQRALLASATYATRSASRTPLRTAATPAPFSTTAMRPTIGEDRQRASYTSTPPEYVFGTTELPQRQDNHKLAGRPAEAPIGTSHYPLGGKHIKSQIWEPGHKIIFSREGTPNGTRTPIPETDPKPKSMRADPMDSNGNCALYKNLNSNLSSHTVSTKNPLALKHPKEPPNPAVGNFLSSYLDFCKAPCSPSSNSSLEQADNAPGVQEDPLRSELGLVDFTSMEALYPHHSCIHFGQSPRMMAPQTTASFQDLESPQPCPQQVGTDSPHHQCDSPYSIKVMESGGSGLSVNGTKDIESDSRTSEGNGATEEGYPIEVNAPEPEDTPAPAKDNEITMPGIEDCITKEQGKDKEEDSVVETEVQVAEAVHEPLAFQIPVATLRAAMSASPNSAASFYSHYLYRGPENRLLNVHYCNTMAVANRVAPYFLKEKVLGFDIEWKPFGDAKSIKENASLIQIASEDRIALFHIAIYPGTTTAELLPKDLRTIIESPDICKVGVAIKGDFSRLRTYLGVDPKGVFELSRLHNLVENYETNRARASSWKLLALAKQVHQHLQLPLHKGAVRQSDWSKPLSHEQISYAATDAYASLRIFDTLDAKRKKLRPIPPLPALCDFDAAPRPKGAPRPKAVPKAAAVSGKEEEAQEQSEVEDDTAYETAAEELADSYDLESASESEASSDSGSSSESADQSEASDAEYVPRSLRRGRVQVDQGENEEEAQDPISQKAHRIGRIDFASLSNPEPSYPVHPSLTSPEASDSNSDSPFEPPLSRPRKRVAKNDGLSKKPSPDADVEMKDVPEDGSVEDQLSTLGIAEPEPQQQQEIPAPAPEPASTSTKSPEYLLADSWAQQHFRNSIPAASSASTSTPARIHASVQQLRAYHLWHYQHQDLAAIARHLRDPPLAESTVSSYIVNAVLMEKLEYEVQDMRVVLRALPAALKLARFKWFVDKVGGV